MLKRFDAIDAVFHALADPTRRQMIERLGEGEASVSDLAAPFPVSLSAVHQQLAILREAGLVATRKEGRVRICRLVPDRLESAEAWLDARRRAWGDRFDRLDDYLAKEERDGEADP